MKQLLPKLKKIYFKKLISKKKSQIDRATIAFWSVLSLTNYLDILLNDRNCNIQSNNQPSTIKLILMKTH